MQTFKFLMAAVGGALVGASAALLYAPARGDETRRRLSRRLDREKKVLSRQLERQREVLIRKGREMLDDAADYFGEELHDATRKIVRMVGH